MNETETTPSNNASTPRPPSELEGVQKPASREPNVTSVTPEEILLGENYALRVMNLSLKKQVTEAEVAKLDRLIDCEQQELMLYRQKLAEKYNIDFNRFEIEAETGDIIPAGSKR